MVPPNSNELQGRGDGRTLPGRRPSPRLSGRDEHTRNSFSPALPDPGAPFREEVGRLQSEAEGLYRRGRYEQAEDVIRRLLRRQAEVLGRNHPDYATGLSMLAELRFLLNDRDEAEVLLRQALTVRKEALGDRHPDYAVTLGCLAAVVRRRGDLDEAGALLQQALRIRKEVLGPFHPVSIRTLGELGRLRSQIRRDAGAGARSRMAPKTPDVPLTRTPGPRVADLSYSPEPESSSGLGDGPAPVDDRPVDGDEPEFGRELATASERFLELGGRLVETARTLESPGVPPPETPVERIDACRRDSQHLLDRALHELAGRDDPDAAPERLDTLEEIAALLDRATGAAVSRVKSEEVRRRAMAILDRVGSVAHSATAEFPPLRECHETAAALRSVILTGATSGPPEEAIRLAEGAHPFVDLLTLIEKGDTLSDEDWARLHTSVGAAFGVPLARAAARGRLVLS
ncbi:MAG: tetratricopeptide repeat-containing protein [Planctomycetaceae bacterium]|nr:tetratricopeptide repeat-containing protein [Planctomycetaceae bacterium]